MHLPKPLPRSIAGDLRAHEAFCRLQNGFSKIWWTVSELVMASEQSPPESSKTCGISGSSFAASFAVPAPRVTRNRIATATPFSWQPDCYTYKNIHMHIYYRNNYDTTKEKKIYQTLKTYGNCLMSVFTEQVTVRTYFYVHVTVLGAKKHPYMSNHTNTRQPDPRFMKNSVNLMDFNQTPACGDIWEHLTKMTRKTINLLAASKEYLDINKTHINKSKRLAEEM